MTKDQPTSLAMSESFPSTKKERDDPESTTAANIKEIPLDFWPAVQSFPREIWLVYITVLLAAFSRVCFVLVVVLFLSTDFNYTDSEASWIYAIHGIAGTGLSLGLGWVVDWLGVKETWLLGNALLFCGRVALPLFYSRRVVLFAIFALIPLGGMPLLYPSLTACINRASNPSNRAVAFSLYVVARSIGSCLAAPVVDGIRRYLVGHTNKSYIDDEYRMILFVSMIGTGLSIIPGFFVRTNVVNIKSASGEVIPKSKPHLILYEIFASPTIWKFLVFNLCFVGLFCLHRHIEATLPKFMIRALGNSVPFASVIGLYSFLTILFVPLMSTTAHLMSLYNTIVIACIVVSASVLPLLYASVWTSVAFIILLSLAEAVLEPRIMEFMCSQAPKGREGMYVVMGNVPSLVSRVVGGYSSGLLLETMCPEPEPGSVSKCNAFGIWMTIFVMTSVTPVLLIIFRPWFASLNINKDSRGDVVDDGINGNVHEDESEYASLAVEAKEPARGFLMSPLLSPRHTPFMGPGTPMSPSIAQSPFRGP